MVKFQGLFAFLLSFFFNMANNNECSDNKVKKSTSSGHFMPSWDNRKYCFKCREANKGDDLCTVKKDCLLCASFFEDQKRKLTVKHSKGKKSVKENSLEKAKIDDSILDEDSSTVTNVAHSSVSNNQALVAILPQLTSISNRLSVVEKRDSPMQADMTVSMDASPRVSSECRKRTISSENTSVEIQSKCSEEENKCNTSSNDNRISVPPKRSTIEISDEGEYNSSQEEKQPGPSYSETLLTVKKMARYRHH